MTVAIADSSTQALLRLLQLASPALPVGAFSYSEGLEMLVYQQRITTQAQLRHWLEQELRHGAIRLDGALMLRCHRVSATGDWSELLSWNQWLSVSRETEELRLQSEQMGRSLLRLLLQLTPPLGMPEPILAQLQGDHCHFATAFGLAAAHWAIAQEPALLGYLQSWATNLVAAAVKLIPLGQTVGQQLLFDLQPALVQASQMIPQLQDDDLETCGWGLSLASMEHEMQYSRLFRS
jgi:urease accessory protein